jgi:hypothetical protein
VDQEYVIGIGAGKEGVVEELEPAVDIVRRVELTNDDERDIIGGGGL